MYPRVKRILDLVLALAAALALSPLLALIALWIKNDSPGPILFRQTRVGQGRRRFQILKFRTMRRETPSEVPTHLLAAPETFITRSGALLRRTSLDELPQIFNIIKGDMSLVGPRPALHNQGDLLAERERWGANEAPVGLTGWAQINGRDELPIPVKAALDGEYMRRRGLWFDIKIIFLTFGRVFRSQGVSEGRAGSLSGRSDE